MLSHCIVSYDKQDRLADLIGQDAWQFEVGSGLLSFGNQYHWQTQLLGTESEASRTWLWAWANVESNIPDHLLAVSLALKAHGEQYGIPELTEPQVSLDQIDGHTLALFASGICEANAYYRCPYEGGALFVMIVDENFPKCTEPEHAALAEQALLKLPLSGPLDTVLDDPETHTEIHLWLGSLSQPREIVLTSEI